MTPALVPVAALTRRAERFRCTRLSATISAGCCVDRQAQVRGRNRRGARHDSEITGAAASPCRVCRDGDQVRARMEGTPR